MRLEHARGHVRQLQEGVYQGRVYSDWNARGDRKERRIVKRRLGRARRLLDRSLERAGGDG